MAANAPSPQINVNSAGVPIMTSSVGNIVLPVTPEMYGAKGDNITDDTAAIQMAFSKGNSITCRPGAQYKITSSIVLSSGTTTLNCAGAQFRPSFGTNWGTPLFKNDNTSGLTTTFKCFDLSIVGACMGIKLAMDTANGQGLKLILNRAYYQSNDGNLRPGTGLFDVTQVDFVTASDLEIWNADLPFNIGGASGLRTCTQIKISQVMISQVRSCGRFEGVDKVIIENLDAANCGSGFSFERDCQRITMTNLHIEGLARAEYPNSSTRVSTGAAKIGWYFAPSQRASSIRMINCSIIDLGSNKAPPDGTGLLGTAIAGVYIGRCDSPTIQSIEMINCSIPLACEGSTAYKPIINRGKFSWHGPWPFTTEPSLSANTYAYTDMVIVDPTIGPYASNNLLQGNSPINLIDVSSGTTPPTITETAAGFANRAGWTVSFNSVYELVKFINLPYGWNTLDVTGFCLSGNPLLMVTQNGAPYTDLVRIQFNGLSDVERRWRISFWNSTPNLGFKIGLTNQNSGVGVDKAYISNISVYQGFAKETTPISPIEVVATLPTASARWVGKTLIVRANNAADLRYICLNNASNSPAWTQL